MNSVTFSSPRIYLSRTCFVIVCKSIVISLRDLHLRGIQPSRIKRVIFRIKRFGGL